MKNKYKGLSKKDLIEMCECVWELYNFKNETPKPKTVKVQCSICGSDIWQDNYYDCKPCDMCGNQSGAFIDRKLRKIMDNFLDINTKGKEMIEITKEEAIEKLNELARLIYFTEPEKYKLVEEKPQQPKIIKSGDTWVTEYMGVDYLCISGAVSHIKKDQLERELKKDIETYQELNISVWKPISEIEITDEIVRLKPSIVSGIGRGNVRLIHIEKNKVFYTWRDKNDEPRSDWMDKSYKINLATVKDLEG
jgi:hypothetical protein